ncbi:ROK family protein [Deinococcus navajonensis]|uniref:ROK family protein n=1 Tax=Deinococcus navajonensis TaxID=309884 RepID=A0ABV8XJU1_9DEIO
MLDRAVMAVDLGGTTTRAAVVKGNRVTERLEMPTLAQQGPELLLGRLVHLVGQLRQAGDTAAVGVACTGRVHGGRVSAVNLSTMPGWIGIPVEARLQQALGRPVRVINDARAATLAEYTAADHPGHFMFVTVSTGIGSGLVLGGQLHEAPGGLDVGLGFTRGLNREPLEYHSSGSALGRLAVAAGQPGTAALFDLAEAGDSRARDLLSSPLQALADRLADAHALLGLQHLCLGGSVGLRQHTREVVQTQLPEVSVRPARYGADAGLIGAALYALGPSPGSTGSVKVGAP